MNARKAILATGAAAIFYAGTMTAGAAVVQEPEQDAAQSTSAATAPSTSDGHVHNATGGYHFTIPADFNGGVFGTTTPIQNRLTFNARRDSDGSVSGWFMYEQEADGEIFKLGGPVTCFKVYDTPVLQRMPEIPAQSQNRAK